MFLLAAAVMVTGVATRARAGCNNIPGATVSFGGTKGTLNRAFVTPGDLVTVGLRTCDGATFDPAHVDDQTVTIAFKAPGSTTQGTLIVLTTRANGCDNIKSACSSFGVSEVFCKPVSSTGLALSVIDANHLRFAFPDPKKFKSSGLTGPTAIAVTSGGPTSVACGLASGTCASQAQSSTPKLLACIDRLFVDDPSCGTTPEKKLTAFMALPDRTWFKKECWKESPPCQPFTGSQIAFALDDDGNVHIPLEWDGISPSPEPTPPEPTPAVHFRRWVRGYARAKDANTRIGIPSSDFLSTYAPDGRLLNPVLGVVPNAHPIQLSGSVDSPTYTVLRIARWACVDPSGGTPPKPYDANCPANWRKTSLFDFSGELKNGGPVVFSRLIDRRICQERSNSKHEACTRNGDSSCRGLNSNCDGYALEADASLTPFTPTVQTPTLLGFAVPEVADGKDRNGDGDSVDLVVTLRDRQSGLELPIGGPPRCALQPASGRAITGTAGTVPPLAAEDDVAAFLESENGQGGCDEDADHATKSAIVRVFERRLSPNGTARVRERRTIPANIAADAAPLVNGQGLVVSDGLVFYRTAGGDGTTLLQTLDTRQTADTLDLDPRHGLTPHTIAPAGAVSVSGGVAVFLGPPPPTVVASATAWAGMLASVTREDAPQAMQMWSREQGLRDLERTADAVANSRQYVAALTLRPAAGDERRREVAVRKLPEGPWTDLGQAADVIAVSDALVVFLTPEAEQHADLNHDHDQDDRVLQVYHADTGGLVVNTGQAADEFVLGDATIDGSRHQLVAFRTSEAAQHDDLDHDGDRRDHVLQVFDATAGTTLDTRQPVVPCTLAGCDPRLPYRIVGSQVRFLTRECDQGGPVTRECADGGTDLNGDGEADDTVVQVYDVIAKRTTALGALDLAQAQGGVDPLQDEDGTLLFPALAGRCAPSIREAPSEGTCSPGLLADPVHDRCVLSSPSTCIRNADCGPLASCAPETLTMAVAMTDGDGDGVPDGADRRPSLFDPVQVSRKPCFLCRLFPRCGRCRTSARP